MRAGIIPTMTSTAHPVMCAADADALQGIDSLLLQLRAAACVNYVQTACMATLYFYRQLERLRESARRQTWLHIK